MARNGTGRLLGGLTLGAITVAAGAALGYYVIGGAHPGPTAGATAGVQETGTPPDPGPAPAPATPRVKPARPNSDYIAPGAPRIHIVEAQSLSLGTSSRPRVARSSSDTSNTTDIPTPDAEASQEAAQQKRAGADAVTAPPTGSAPTPDPEASQAGTATPGDGSPAQAVTAPAATDTPPTPDAAPGKRAAPPPADSEASQAGDTPAAAKGAGAAQYRIQAGTFTDPKSAHDYLTNLQSRGYDASLHADHQGGQTIYHVQVGAYHDRAAAEDAAVGFRHDGVPVTVAPITP